MCDQGYKLIFDSEKCEIRKEGYWSVQLQELQTTYMC
jgi:hypothetical protein